MDALGPRFERFLAAVEPAREGRVIACEAITGGYSRISARAQVRWRDGVEETFILRGDPPPGSGVFTSDRDAEAELLGALPAATPVSTPRVRWYDGSGEYLGSKAIVMDCAPAVSLQDEMARAQDAGALTDLFIDTFAAVHATPLDRLPARMPHPPDWLTYLDGVLANYDRMAGQYPGSAPVLANGPTMKEMARRSGEQIVKLVLEDVKPREIMTRGAFHNAVAAVLAVSGSINCVKHLQATAIEAGVDVDIFKMFNDLGEKIPVLSAVRPNGEDSIDDFEAAGGARALMKQLSPLLDLEILIRMLFRRRRPELLAAEFARSAR